MRNLFTSKKRSLIFLFIFIYVSLITISIAYQQKLYTFRSNAAIRPINPPVPTKNDWRFGLGLETWNYDKVHCYSDDPLFQPPNGHREDIVGQEVPCPESYMQHLRKNTNGMKMVSTANSQWRLNSNAMNVSTFTALDPSANTQMIWYHYANESEISPMSSYTQAQLADIYAHSDTPGSVVVKIVRSNTSNGWKLKPPQIGVTRVGNRAYPICKGCIYHSDEFKKYLQDNINFTSYDLSTGKQGWYTFYILAEVELTNHPSHYLAPEDFAAVLNEYVTTVSNWFPNKKASFIPGSPTHLELTNYQDYYRTVYTYLLPEVKRKLNLNGLDIFLTYETPDTDFPGVAATTDEDLQIKALEFNQQIRRASNFFHELTGNPSVLTQTSVLTVRVPHQLNGVRVFSGPPCSWCRDNEDVWKTTQYTAARLTQLAYRQLKLSATTNYVAGWSWWQGQRTQYWYESMANSTWGGVSSGVQWLASIDDCNSEADYGYRHDPPMLPLGHPSYSQGYLDCAKRLPLGTMRTTPVGDVYLGMANYNYTYRPAGAPSWWPQEDSKSCYFRSVASVRDLNGDVIKNNNFVYQYENKSSPPQIGTITLGDNKVLGNSEGYRGIVKDGYAITTLTNLPQSFKGIKTVLGINFPASSDYVFDHWECESYNFKTGQLQGCDNKSGAGLKSSKEDAIQVTSDLTDTIDCNTTHFYNWYFKRIQ